MFANYVLGGCAGTYLVFLWDRSTCMCWSDRCRCLHSDRAGTDTHWSLWSSLYHGTQGHTNRQKENVSLYMVCNVTCITPIYPKKKNYLTAVASQIISTCGSILARIWWTLIHLFLAVAACVTSLTSAIVCVSCIQTLARVSAQVSHVYAWNHTEKQLKKASNNVLDVVKTHSVMENGLPCCLAATSQETLGMSQ